MDYRLNKEELAIASACLKTALEKGASKARITLNKSCLDMIGTLNGEIDKVSHCLDRSMSVVLFVDGKFGSFSTNRLDSESVDSFIGNAIQTVRLMAEDPCRDLPSPDRTAKDAASGNELGLYDSAYESIEASDRLKKALDASAFKSMGSGPGWTLVSEECEYSDSVFDTYIIDSQGLECRHTETSFEYGADVTIADEGGDRYCGLWWEATPMLKDFDISGVSAKAIGRAVAQIGPQPRRSGSYKCVIDSECASKVVTPLLNALNAYSLQQNNSFLCGTAGRKMFHEGLTIIDCCRSAGETGSRLFDSEGVATKVHPVIENGVVNEYFVNTYMSNKMGLEPTIEDVTRPKIMPWPEQGLDRESIMKKCRNGILVTGFNGGNSNSATGDYSFGIEGFAFKDGKITHPVREMLMTGNLIDLWNSLLAVGEDARLCMSKLIPTLAFENVDFSG